MAGKSLKQKSELTALIKSNEDILLDISGDVDEEGTIKFNKKEGFLHEKFNNHNLYQFRSYFFYTLTCVLGSREMRSYQIIQKKSKSLPLGSGIKKHFSIFNLI